MGSMPARRGRCVTDMTRTRTLQCSCQADQIETQFKKSQNMRTCLCPEHNLLAVHRAWGHPFRGILAQQLVWRHAPSRLAVPPARVDNVCMCLEVMGSGAWEACPGTPKCGLLVSCCRAASKGQFQASKKRFRRAKRRTEIRLFQRAPDKGRKRSLT